MVFKKAQIYEIAERISVVINKDIVLPIKTALLIQSNIEIISKIVKEIENQREEILKKYGTYNEEDGNYHFEEEAAREANSELQALFDEYVEVNIKMLTEDDIKNAYLSFEQAAAISFMIGE